MRNANLWLRKALNELKEKLLDSIAFIIMLAAWIWSVARGIQVSFACMACNFIFPPVSQLIFAIYEQKMRAPLFLMVAPFVLLFFMGEVSFEFGSE